MLLNPSKTLFKPQILHRNLFQWINIIFNKVDEDLIKIKHTKFKMLLNPSKTLFKPQILHRNLFQWINIIFNKVDEDRRKAVGPDRSCAEWLLRNGAFVKWNNAKEFLTDYNKLPDEDTKLHIVEVDASESSIMHYGFEHFKGCEHIRKIIFHKCSYLEDEALKGLLPLKQSLLFLHISNCYNITENGLRHLTPLANLKELFLSELPYVKDKEKIANELKNTLSKCNVQFN